MDTTDEIAKLVKDCLNTSMPSERRPSKPEGQRRFRFAIGNLCLAIFCMTVALFPWPGAHLFDKLMWVGFAITLLLIGSWQLDKSSRASDTDDRDPPPSTRVSVSHSNVHLFRKNHL